MPGAQKEHAKNNGIRFMHAVKYDKVLLRFTTVFIRELRKTTRHVFVISLRQNDSGRRIFRDTAITLMDTLFQIRSIYHSNKVLRYIIFQRTSKKIISLFFLIWSVVHSTLVLVLPHSVFTIS